MTAVLIAAAVLAACGKKGDPLPPLRPVPAMVSGLAAERNGSAVTVRFTVPTASQDPGTPSATDRIEVYSVTLAASAPAPTADQIAVAVNIVKSVLVRREDETANPSAPKTDPGGAVTYMDTVNVPAEGGPFIRYYTAAGFAGRRRGAVAPVLSIPMGSGPAAPTGLTSRHDETTITLSWQASGAGHRFVVDRVGQGLTAIRVTPEPIAVTEFSTPVTFGAEQCFLVRAVEVIGAVTLVGDPAVPSCITPTDTFAPAPPSELKGFPGETGIDLTWTASASSDVAGYIVLRAEGTSDTLQRLTAAPVTATQYRDETVRSGVLYSYVVVAIDRATPPNESRHSNRDTVTARSSRRP